MPSLFSRRNIAIAVILVTLLVGAGIFIYQKGSAPSPETPHPDASSPKREVIGRSVENREIEAYTYGTGATHLLFVGGIHGGYEWNTVLLAYQFMDYLVANPSFVPEGISITVIPSLNPDGVYKVIKKEGRFAISDVPATNQPVGTGRFNARNVDVNRNFDCKWQPESTWRNTVVSAGTKPFSEPESATLRDFVLKNPPDGVIFWHSQAGGVYASACESEILPKTLAMVNIYAKAAGYGAFTSFDYYAITGDADSWLASKNIPAVSVELKTHELVEWEENLKGITAILNYYAPEQN